MEQWWVNGTPGRLIDVTDRGLAYGDGLFETIAIRAGQPRFLDLHLDRLFQGCSRLGIAAPDRSTLAAELATTSAGFRHGVLKLLVTRGPGPRGYALPTEPATTVAWGLGATEPGRSGPVTVRWCETMTSANPATAGLKSLARLEQVLARAEWSQPDIAEGLMASTEGRLVGGTASNVFMVAGDRVLTPDVSRSGIAGIMRRVVLETARTAGIAATETHLEPGDLLQATEVFLTNALTGIRPVHRLGNRTWEAGTLTRRLQALLVERGVGECVA
jgi:4-amino-4-deoxychorismate lyase